MSEDKGGVHAENIINQAMEFLRLCEEAESVNRQLALEDHKFRDGEQWPAELQQSRKVEDRPCLTINKVDAHCTKVANQQRQQRPRIKVDPVGGVATRKVADIYQGMVRHIENNRGGGDLAYDTAYDSAITGGFGYFRVLADYAGEDSFEQELYLAPIENPFSVYYDRNSSMPDGSDAEACIITDMLPISEFRRKYPGKNDGANFAEHGTGDSFAHWVTRKEIRIAEYFVIEKTKAELVLLSDGTTAFADKLPADEELTRAGVEKVRSRPTWRRKVKWYKLTAMEILEGREWPGKWIPVIPVYGKTRVIDGKRKHAGLVRNARDPAKMVNYWRTSLTESIALAPKAKWVMAEGQDEGYKTEWTKANVSSFPVLHYKQTDVDGREAPPPQRVQPEPPPEGAMAAANIANDDLSSVLGVVDPAIRVGGNVSGKALNAERQQSDESNFNFYDNMMRSVAQAGRQLVDLIPHFYNEPGRIIRIIGDDGEADMETINQPNPNPQPNADGVIAEILNDVRVGEYAVVMDTGPGYTTKRQEAVTAMVPLFGANEKLMDVAGDVMFRNMDFPGADVIADRLAAVNPLSQIDEQSEIPPGAQMKMKQMGQQLQQAGQQIQALEMQIKNRADIEKMRQDGETRRALMRETGEVHRQEVETQGWMRDIDARTATSRHDTETRAVTALNVAEIGAIRELLAHHMSNRHDLQMLEKQADREDRQLEQKANETEPR